MSSCKLFHLYQVNGPLSETFESSWSRFAVLCNILFELLEVDTYCRSCATCTTQSENNTSRVAIAVFKRQNQPLIGGFGSIDWVDIAIRRTVTGVRLRHAATLPKEQDHTTTYENSSAPTILIPDSSLCTDDMSPLTNSSRTRLMTLFAASLSTPS